MSPGAGQSTGAQTAGLVLLIEDESLVLRVATDMLVALGFEVVAAADADRALEVFRRYRDRLALVLLDSYVPGMDGSELLAALDEERNGIPIVLCSGYDASDLGPRFAGRRIAGFLQKPYRLEQMQEILREALATS